MSLLGAAAITGAAALAGQGIGAYQAGKMNKRAEKFAWNMYGQQRSDALSDWNMQNAYNSPVAQMQRLKDAGLNPHLVYGTGSPASTADAPRGSNASAPRYTVPQLDLGSVVQQAMATKQLQSNIARTDAETEMIKARTVDQNFQNSVNELIGVNNIAERYQWASDEIAIKSQKANAEWEMMKTVGYNDNFADRNSPAAKAMFAGFKRAEVELENARKLGDIRTYESVIKKFESDLTKQGIAPGTPWYFKIIGDLLGDDIRGAHNGFKQFLQDTK